MKNWRQYLKAIVAFAGSLASAIGVVAAAKHGEPFTNADWLTVLVVLLGVGGTTAGVYGAKNEPKDSVESMEASSKMRKFRGID